jgi:tRNA(Ile)-lysidine synthase TilS/MesJ
MEDVFGKGGIGVKYPVWKTNPDDFSSVGKAKLKSLKETVEEIEELVKERQALSNGFIKEAEKLKRDINNFLLEGAPKGEDDSEFARERAELRKKQIEISEIQLNEKVGCWRDISELKKELRDREKELTEKESRSEELKKILEG